MMGGGRGGGEEGGGRGGRIRIDSNDKKYALFSTIKNTP